MSTKYSSCSAFTVLYIAMLLGRIGEALPIHHNGTSNEISCAGDMELTKCHRNCGLQTTCEELFYGINLLRHCDGACHPGCQCPQRNGEDTYLTVEDRCVTKYECGCVHRGVFHGVNERFFRGSLLCSCEQGRTLCNSIFGWLSDNKATEVWPDNDGSAAGLEKSSLPESISFEYSSFEYSNYDDEDTATVTLQTHSEKLISNVGPTFTGNQHV